MPSGAGPGIALTPERWRRIEELYHAALDLEADRREALLEDACGEDDELRRELDSLLASNRSGGDWLARPARQIGVDLVGGQTDGPATGGALPGHRLGSYVVQSLAGAGGITVAIGPWIPLSSPPLSDFDLLCIGSGPAGQRAAVQAAKLGKRAAVVERRRCVGGVCIDTGTIPSKTFREAVLALTGSSFDRRRRDRARPTAAELLERVADVVARESDVVSDQLARNDVDLVRGEASFIDPHTVWVQSDGAPRAMTADTVLIAVGTEPADPPGVAPDGETVITSDGVLSLAGLPRSIAVVGGGVIGIEYASMFAALGIGVTLVERRPRPLEFLDWEIVDELIHQMRNRNVTFRLGEAVLRLEVPEGTPRHAILLLESGKRIVADLVLFSAGRVGATARLNLAAAGLTADERGRIEVDEHFRTAVPHIYAAGDVIGYPSLAATSSEQGRLAACHAFGVTASTMSPHFPIGIYAIPEISMVGATEHELTEKKIPYETGIARYREIARGQILGDHSGLLKLLFQRETRALLGVHAIGTGATELIHIGQAVLALGGGLDYFLQTVFNYPTLAECYKVAALDASNKLRR